MTTTRIELKSIFDLLSKAYSKLPSSVAEELGVNIVVRSIEDGSFFDLVPEDQRRILRRMETLHVGRGEMFYRLEKDGMVDPHFWSRFKQGIDAYLEDFVGKSYQFPEK